MNSSNPIFSNLEKNKYQGTTTSVATKSSVAFKTVILIAIAIITGYASIFIPENVLFPLLIISALGSFIFALVALYSTNLSMIFSMLYAAAQGLMYGLVTYALETVEPGIGLTAIIGTASVFGVMFVLYSTGILRGSSFLRKLVLGSLISIILGSLILSVTSLMNPSFATAFNNNFTLLIAIYIGLIILGGFMLILDFERADNIIAMGLSKKAEWQAAFGILLTVIWIYINMLKLIFTIIRSSRN